MEFFADLQNQFDALPSGSRGIILNGVDTVATAKSFNPTGASGLMVDHFTILQFLLTGEPMDTDKCNVKPPDACGNFNVSAMDTLFQLVGSKVAIRIKLDEFCIENDEFCIKMMTLMQTARSFRT